MKKLVLTAAIVLGFAMGTFAQGYFQDNEEEVGGGLFGRGNTVYEEDELFRDGGPFLPAHGEEGNADAGEAPLGGGALLLIGFGAAYAMSKKNRK